RPRRADLKDGRAPGRHRGDLAGVLVVVAERHELLEACPAESFDGDGDRRTHGTFGRRHRRAAENAKTAARHVLTTHHGVEVMDLAEILRSRECCANSTLSIHRGAPNWTRFSVYLRSWYSTLSSITLVT